MKNINDLEKEATQTLESLNSLQQVEANEFLHAKILHRMQNKNTVIADNTGKLMLRLVAVLCLFICLNGVSYYMLKQTHTTTAKAADANGFADAYGLNNNLNSY